MIKRILAFSNPRTRRVIRRVLVLTVIASVLEGAAFVALAPFLTALLSGDLSGTRLWLGVLGGIGLGYVGVTWAAGENGKNAGSMVIESLLGVMGDRLVELPIGYFGADRSGELSDLASRGVVFASAAPYAILGPIINALVAPGTALVGALILDWRIGLVMAATAPLMWLAYRRVAAKVGQADREHVRAVGEAAGRVIEFARVQPALRAAGDNSIARGLVDSALRARHQTGRRVHLTGGAAVGLFGATVYLSVVAVIVVGAWLALDGAMTMPQTIALAVLAARFAEPIANSGALGGGVALANNTLAQIQALLDQPTLPEPSAAPSTGGARDAAGQVPDAVPSVPASQVSDAAGRAPGAASPAVDQASVRFDSVSFGYDDRPVLSGLSFEASAGAMTAIVGPSGSGKTTIIRLVARFYDPDSGTVSIGGRPLPELGSLAVARAVAPVFQDVYLFDGTILDNIWLGRPRASRDQVIAAGRRARVDEVVDRLPGGWDTMVGEGGTRLSGGERQRVSIARALLKDAPIVLLDEATSALDVGNERAIQDAFEAVRRDRTVIVVAHRLSTIAAADQILMLDRSGTITERGAHQQLLAAGGPYARYWRERTEAAGWRLSQPRPQPASRTWRQAPCAAGAMCGGATPPAGPTQRREN
ncbi:MAG: ABC transporter ATP-binding protein/permease [Bifidobacteriaceae bacterium]|jgi:ATP-binding cassette subfamily B protein|nr:ABC transporter ATP-binding protein/permease [Bifidobacteriaceae bacterium]